MTSCPTWTYEYLAFEDTVILGMAGGDLALRCGDKVRTNVALDPDRYPKLTLIRVAIDIDKHPSRDHCVEGLRQMLQELEVNYPVSLCRIGNYAFVPEQA